MAVTAQTEYQMLIGGEWVASDNGTFDVTDPATGEVVGTVPDGSRADIERAVDAAAEALPAWRALTGLERGRLLRKAADGLMAEADKIAAIMTAEQGKPLAEARGEVVYAASFYEWFAGEAERIYGMTIPSIKPNDRVTVLRQAVGVTAAITPWNFPAAMMTRKLGPALAAGCTMVVKPAGLTPLTALEVGRVMQEAGIPAGVVNIVTTKDSRMVSEVLFGDERVRKISFTGSTEVGKLLIKASAGQVKRLSLELGGHAPVVVFDDADLDNAVDQTIASKYRNAGQTCVCANRIYVQRGIHEEFTKRFAEKVEALPVGVGTTDGVQVGPLIDGPAVDKSAEHVADALRQGATLVTGGERLTDGELSRGHFFQPTVLDGVTPDMLISQEETFGPVAALSVFDDEDEAVELANNTPYGLAAYFFTRDYARLQRFAERLDYGIIGANTGIISAANVPFGGMKESGFGREGGPHGIDEYLEVKYVAVAGVGSL